jgi:ATP-dependent Clp protease ATP-binding subunit ClpC
MFLGPTGVGKTETARALAEYLFDDESAMIRLDMTEYQERHTVSRLIGAPPGYVGYEDAGKLSEAVRRRPYSVVLFDEIEKAHPDVFNLLLQILDDGRLTDSRGRTVSFQNTVIVMTSNIGAERLMGTRAPLGFQGDGEDEQRRRTTELLLEELRRHFRPEFVNRVDEIVVFQPLTREQISRIVELMLETTRRRMRGQAVTLELSDAAKARLAERGFDPQYGARPLRRLIQREIETEVSRLLLDGAVREGDTVQVDVEEDRFTFTTARGEARADEEPRAEA